MDKQKRVGTAGWSIPNLYRDEFDGGGSHLERYAKRFCGAEINSSFYRSHKPATYERWASVVPGNFRFAVKLPKEITHTRKLIDIDEPLKRFVEEIGGLDDKLGPILVQFPPSLAFESAVAECFFNVVRSRLAGEIACEPRHASWFDASADGLWSKFQIARVAADPARVPAAAVTGGWTGLAYYRLHGSPKTYYSAYGEAELNAWAAAMRTGPALRSTWCIFDNTASGAATGNALSLGKRLTSIANRAATTSEDSRVID